MCKAILEFFTKVLAFFDAEAPVATAVMALIPGLQIPAAGLAFLNGIPTLCHVAEQLIGPKNGDTKYDLVTTMANAGLMTLQKAFPTEAAKYAQLAIAIPTVIETTIANVKQAQLAAAPPALAK